MSGGDPTVFGPPPPLPDAAAARRLADAFGLTLSPAASRTGSAGPHPARGARVRAAIARGPGPAARAVARRVIAPARRGPTRKLELELDEMTARLTVVEARLAALTAAAAASGTDSQGSPAVAAELRQLRAGIADLRKAVARATGETRLR